MGRKSPPGRGPSRRLRPAGPLAHCPQRSRPRSVARPSGLQVSQPPPRALPPRGTTRKEGKEARPPDRLAQTDEQGRERPRERERRREGGRAEGNRKIIYGDGPRCIGRGGHRKEGGKGRSGAVARLANEQRRRELLPTPPFNRSDAVGQFRFLPFLLLRRPSNQWRYFVLINCTIFWSYTAWVNVTTSQGTGPKNDEKDQNHRVLPA